MFYYERILNLPAGPSGSLTVLGSVWHYAVEVYEEYDGDIGLALKTFDYYWDSPELLGQTIDFWHPRTSYEGLRKRGREMLQRYHDLQPFQYGTTLGTEIEFVVPIGSHEIHGIIDKLQMRPRKKELEIIDFKTGAKTPTKLRHNLQFTSYMYATTQPEFWAAVPGHEDGYELYRNYKRSGWWLHARNTKKIHVGERTQRDYDRLLLAIDEMEKAIDQGIFPLTISGEECGYCPYEEDVCATEVTNAI